MGGVILLVGTLVMIFLCDGVCWLLVMLQVLPGVVFAFYLNRLLVSVVVYGTTWLV